jgi:hypothetical protein
MDAQARNPRHNQKQAYPLSSLVFFRRSNILNLKGAYGMTGQRLPIAVLAVMFSTRLLGCECAELRQQVAFKYAVVVFQGTVTHIDHLNPIDEQPKTGAVQGVPIPREVDDHTVATFRVTRAWKGPVKNGIKVYATARPSMCDGYKFKDGVEYVVYASLNLHPEWEELKPYSQGATIYGIDDCPLRIRTDLNAESIRLGRFRSFK